jgi:hypothetical protein
MNDLNNFDIKDSDIRILGQKNNAAEPKIMKGAQTAGHKEKKSHFTWAGVLLSVLIIALIIALKTCRNSAPEESVYCDVVPTCESQESQTTFGHMLSTESNAYIVVSHQTVDDIPLRLLRPTGGHMEMVVGALDSTDTSIVMAACAADYRADNGEIAGAFVYKGELLSRGHPKLGFCAIIGREVTMGMSPETPLFERAVEQSGYFFRQHSLVHNGELGEKTPPGKAIRRALCYDGKDMFVVDTDERESLHDFAQALIDMGVQEAISLVGNIPLSLYEDEHGNRTVSDIPHAEGKTVNYIVWKR